MGRTFSGFWQKYGTKITGLILCLLIIGSSLGILFRHYKNGGQTDLVAKMEAHLLDLRFLLRGQRKPTGQIGILAIDEKSLQKFGRFPFSRRYYQKAFENLKNRGVEWIGFDVVWSMPELPLLEDVSPQIERLEKIQNSRDSDSKVIGILGEELAKMRAAKEASFADQSIAKGIKSFANIVLGFFYYSSVEEANQLGNNKFAGLEQMESAAIQAVILPDGKTLADYPALDAKGIVGNTPYIAGHAEYFAFFNNDGEDDAIMRWVNLVRIVNGRLMPSLSLKTAAQMLKREIVVFFDDFGVTDISLMNPNDDQDLIKIPVDHQGRGRILLNHLGPGKVIRHFSLADAYDDSFSAKEIKALKGLSLLMGPTAIAINDQRPNPFDAGMNGVENHAAVIDNIVSKNFMRRTDRIYVTELLIVLIAGGLFAPLMMFGRAVISGIAVLLFLMGYYFADKYFWFGRGEWVYMGMPCIEIFSMFVVTTMYKYLSEERERKKVKGAFGLYLAPEVIDQVLTDPNALRPGGEKKELTVFFSDVRSFTTISESLSPEKLCELMNDYFTPMADIILRTRGVLDKYIGDAIMAFWGAPIPQPNHADIACMAAIEMLFALDKLRVDLGKKGFPAIEIGIGLNTGLMSVGNMGSPQRFCYTVMGDAVNLGSRLEGATKDYGIKIMISESTHKKLTNKSLFTRDLDDIRVKGKMEPVKVFELMRPDMLRNEAAMQNIIGEFHAGREAYRAQDWAKARKHFLACLILRPEDGPAAMYLERIKDREQEPFVEAWDGVYTRKHK